MTVILETHGDLFESKASVLLCPVNSVGAMGKGLAKTFRDKHPDFYYRAKQQVRVNKFHKDTLMLFQPHGASYRIVAAPTKIHWANPSPPELVEATIKRLAWLGEHKKILSLAMPALGCGEGQLSYEQVREWIYRYLDPNPMDVEIWLNP